MFKVSPIKYLRSKSRTTPSKTSYTTDWRPLCLLWNSILRISFRHSSVAVENSFVIGSSTAELIYRAIQSSLEAQQFFISRYSCSAGYTSMTAAFSWPDHSSPLPFHSAFQANIAMSPCMSFLAVLNNGSCKVRKVALARFIIIVLSRLGRVERFIPFELQRVINWCTS